MGVDGGVESEDGFVARSLLIENLNVIFDERKQAACMFLFPAAGLQDRSRLQAPYCARKAKAQERRGDPRHSHGIYVRRGHGRRCHTAALQVPAAATAEGEDALAQLSQQLHQG